MVRTVIYFRNLRKSIRKILPKQRLPAHLYRTLSAFCPVERGSSSRLPETEVFTFGRKPFKIRLMSGTVRSGDWARLARYVAARRAALGISQEEVEARGGPGAKTFGLIENGGATSMTPRTIERLDKGLLWTPGSTRATLNGGEPKPLPDLETQPIDQRRTRLEAALRAGDDAVRTAEGVLAAFPDVENSGKLAQAIAYYKHARDIINAAAEPDPGLVGKFREEIDGVIAVTADAFESVRSLQVLRRPQRGEATQTTPGKKPSKISDLEIRADRLR
ncbi:helix-turn-helix domain-containing protein [Mycobacteroides immunogenum]|nr:helix-turn-helix domain-containing protein [Mycobacteroides immunogenum]